MDLGLPENEIGDGLSGEALLCSEYLGDIKLKLPDNNLNNQVSSLLHHSFPLTNTVSITHRTPPLI